MLRHTENKDAWKIIVSKLKDSRSNSPVKIAKRSQNEAYKNKFAKRKNTLVENQDDVPRKN